MPIAKTRAKAIAVMDRKAEALTLRRRGMKYREIADKLGYATPGGAYKAVRSAMDATIREPADELRQHELGRLEELHQAVWDKALEGNLNAIDRVLKVAERRAKLVGLDKLADGFMSPAEIQQALVTLVSIAQKHLKTPEEREAMLLDVQRLLGAGGMTASPAQVEEEDTSEADTTPVDTPVQPIPPEQPTP